MQRYGVREVEKLLQLPRSTVRALIRAGFVSPTRGPRRAWLFSFQDLTVLRTAKALIAAKVSPRRITRFMRELRAKGDSGQRLLAFEGEPAKAAPKVVDWMERAMALERDDVEAALKAYERAIADDPEWLDAHANRVCLLQDAGRLADAERACREAIKACGSEPILLYHLALLCEKLDKPQEAIRHMAHYRRLVRRK